MEALSCDQREAPIDEAVTRILFAISPKELASDQAVATLLTPTESHVRAEINTSKSPTTIRIMLRPDEVWVPRLSAQEGESRKRSRAVMEHEDVITVIDLDPDDAPAAPATTSPVEIVIESEDELMVKEPPR